MQDAALAFDPDDFNAAVVGALRAAQNRHDGLHRAFALARLEPDRLRHFARDWRKWEQATRSHPQYAAEKDYAAYFYKRLEQVYTLLHAGKLAEIRGWWEQQVRLKVPPAPLKLPPMPKSWGSI